MNVAKALRVIGFCVLLWSTSVVVAQTSSAPEKVTPSTAKREALAKEKKVAEWPAGKIGNLKGQAPIRPLISLSECLLLELEPRLHDGCTSGSMCYNKASHSGVCITEL